MNKIILTVVVLLGAMSCAPVRDKEYDLEPLEDVVDSRALENSYEISQEELATSREILKEYYNTIKSVSRDTISYEYDDISGQRIYQPYHYDQYVKQYIGVMENGKKWIYVYMVIKDMGIHKSPKSLLELKDCGSQAIDVVIDLELNAVKSFTVHKEKQ